ncbi:MAG: SOS response-associated peptidase [Gemmatimonadota bacterium]
MCGRYSLGMSEGELIEVFDVPPLEFEYRPRYNIAPSQDAPIVARDFRGRRMGLMRWGFRPRWARDDRPGFINARAETAASKPSFRDAFRKRRCLVPADGFYEWAAPGGGTPGEGAKGPKVPYWFHPAQGRLLGMGGIWEGDTFAILTTDANGDVRDVHGRMPLLIHPEDWKVWLDAATGPERLGGLLGPPPDGTLLRHAVSTRVNSPANEGPDLIEPVEGG